MKSARLTLAFCALLAASACTTAPRGPSNDAIDRALSRASGAAQPSDVVAIETAYAREVRDAGALKAATEYGVSDAVMHGDNGPVSVGTFFAQRSASETRATWKPRAVWMSCDGSLAISNGRFQTATGLIGTYATVWQRQSDRSYRFTYSLAELDDPQPAPKPAPATPKEGDIVVTAMDAVQGIVADCPTAESQVPPPRMEIVPQTTKRGGDQSSDRTLSWLWSHSEGGQKVMESWYFSDGRNQEAVRYPARQAVN